MLVWNCGGCLAFIHRRIANEYKRRIEGRACVGTGRREGKGRSGNEGLC